MKIIVVTSFLALCIINGMGQSKKNDLKLTVSALPLLGSTETSDFGLNGLVIKPSTGYYISDRTSIELNFSYASMNNITVGTIDSYYNSFAFVPALRNNFVNRSKLRVFFEFGFGFGTIKYDADTEDDRNYIHDQLSGGISILSIGLGMNYYFNDKFGIELLVPYLSTNNITSEYSNQLYSGIGPTLGFAFRLS